MTDNLPKLPPRPGPIERIFEGERARQYPTVGERLAYSRKCLALCVEHGWKHSAAGWEETINALAAQEPQP